jgi:hypothetical protein
MGNEKRSCGYTVGSLCVHVVQICMQRISKSIDTAHMRALHAIRDA